MSSEPGVSSYDKIFGHLAECPEFKDARARWRERLAALRYEKYGFSYTEVYRKNAQGVNTRVKDVVPSFYASDGKTVGFYKDDQTGAENVQFFADSDLLLTESEAKAVVTANFGTKRCKTYFCKLEKVVNGDDRKGHRKEGFSSWARTKLRLETSAQIAEVQERIVKQAVAARASDEFARDRRRFFERQVIEEIKGVVLKYFDQVDGSVIKEAMDEVIAHAVMES